MAQRYEDVDITPKAPAAKEAGRRGWNSERNRFVDTARNPNVGDTGDPALRPALRRRGTGASTLPPLSSFRAKRQAREAGRTATRK